MTRGGRHRYDSDWKRPRRLCAEAESNPASGGSAYPLRGHGMPQPGEL